MRNFKLKTKLTVEDGLIVPNSGVFAVSIDPNDISEFWLCCIENSAIPDVAKILKLDLSKALVRGQLPRDIKEQDIETAVEEAVKNLKKAGFPRHVVFSSTPANFKRCWYSWD